MSQSFLRTTVSVLTLNALLAVYENQPIEFYEYAHGIHPPRLNAFIPLPQVRSSITNSSISTQSVSSLFSYSAHVPPQSLPTVPSSSHSL